jgi:hypothetical protein
MRRILAGVSLLIALTACGESSLEPLPLQVGINATPAITAPGDTVVFVVNAQGGSLYGVELDFGDGATDQYGTSGARTARITFRHVYDARGTFTARVVATDALAGQKEATIDITVN